MRVLLDTHAFLWWMSDDSQLSTAARAIISDPENTIFVSVVSVWEIIIKQGTGKLILSEPAEDYVPDRIRSNQFSTLSVEMRHILRIASLPALHRDPFDRLLIAQSECENLAIISVDHLIQQYSITVIW
ncbi:type II toxin-antitoxin system VapC family toxin [Leptolyngbya sp. AN03gr2]|uniref:type II toxin-antitoxin system VapC family toxin n=1 Tax=unclassified Leptolyngbya TaxID=2650499 RepID=UPI003D323DAF